MNNPLASADVNRLAEALRASAEQSQQTTFEVLLSAAGYLLSEMEARVAVDTGNLRESLGVRVVGDAVHVGPDVGQAPYAAYVELGTKPHEIRPKSASALRFKVGNQTIYARVVRHPGTKPQPYIVPAFEAWVDSLGPMAAEANAQTIYKEYG